MKTLEPSEAWIYGLEEAKLMQMRRDASCSLRENLIWLEETTEFKKKFAQELWTRKLQSPNADQNALVISPPRSD